MGLVVVAQFGYDWHLKRNFLGEGGGEYCSKNCLRFILGHGLYSETYSKCAVITVKCEEY